MKKRKNLKEQALSSSKPKGLPAPGDLANRIKASGMSAEELMSYLGAVMTRASAGASPSPEAPDVEPPTPDLPPPPPPSPEAVKEGLENRLLDDLLRDIKNSGSKR